MSAGAFSQTCGDAVLKALDQDASWLELKERHGEELGFGDDGEAGDKPRKDAGKIPGSRAAIRL